MTQATDDHAAMRRELEISRIQTVATAADTRSRQALSMAVELKRNAWTQADHTEYQDDVRSVQQRRDRWARRLVVVTMIAVAFALVGSWVAFLHADRARAQTSSDLAQLRQSAYASCVARNAALVQQRELYADFARIEELDTDQSEMLRDAKIASYQRAINSLPDAVDCSIWD